MNLAILINRQKMNQLSLAQDPSLYKTFNRLKESIGTQHLRGKLHISRIPKDNIKNKNPTYLQIVGLPGRILGRPWLTSNLQNY